MAGMATTLYSSDAVGGDGVKTTSAGVARLEGVVDHEGVVQFGCLTCGQQWLAFVNLPKPTHCPGCGRRITKVER